MKTNVIPLAAAMLTVFVAPPARAAVTEAWVHRYSSGNLVSNSRDWALKVVRDRAGDVIVTGKSDDCDGDIRTIKYSGADGLVLWQQRYTAPDCGPGTSCCRDCELQPTAMAVDGSANVVVAAQVGGWSGGGYSYAAKYAAADGTLLWEQKRYDVGGGFTAVAVDGDGNVVVAVGLYTAKYASADGALLWEQRYKGPANSGDYASAVAVDGSGNVVVTRTSYNGGSDFQTADYYTAKYAAADGALLWEKRYNSPANSDDQARAVAVDGSGNVVVTGTSHNNINDFYSADYYTAKYAADDGALLWEKRYNGPANSADYPSAVAVDGSGNVVVTGTSYNGGSDFQTADYYTAKYAAATGALLWEKRYTGPANTRNGASALALDGSGNVVVTGTSHNNEGLTAEYYTAKYGADDGALLWEQRCDGYTWGCVYGAFDYSPAITVDGNGNVLLTGSSKANYYTAKYAGVNGAVLWEQGYDGPPNKLSDYPYAVAMDVSGNVIVTGYSYNSSGDRDFYTAKYAVADGALLWEKRYNGPGNSDDSASAVDVDASGNVVVMGTFYSATNSGFYTVKYAAADGALLWDKHHSSGAPNSYGEAQAIAVDENANVVVTGSLCDGSGNCDYYTAKYSAADGALLWEKRYNGPADREDAVSAVAVDGSGNVVVTGLSSNLDYDYYTAKYAAADGALLWEKRYDGGGDYASGVAVDGSGNVVMTGYSYTGPGNGQADYYTAKYAAVDGALLWEKRYNGPANHEDRAYAVAVDGRGNVVVTGYSSNPTGIADFYTAKYAAAVAVDSMENVVVAGSFRSSAGNNDYYTAKYSGSNGALLWAKSYNGPANGEDIVRSSRSLALGPNGIVAVTGSSEANFRSRKVSDYATIVYREVLPPLSVKLVPIGIRIRFSGAADRSYNIESARAVTGPWSIIATPTVPLDGIVEYTDTNALTGATFYRTSTP